MPSCCYGGTSVKLGVYKNLRPFRFDYDAVANGGIMPSGMKGKRLISAGHDLKYDDEIVVRDICDVYEFAEFSEMVKGFVRKHKMPKDRHRFICDGFYEGTIVSAKDVLCCLIEDTDLFRAYLAEKHATHFMAMWYELIVNLSFTSKQAKDCRSCDDNIQAFLC